MVPGCSPDPAGTFRHRPFYAAFRIAKVSSPSTKHGVFFSPFAILTENTKPSVITECFHSWEDSFTRKNTERSLVCDDPGFEPGSPDSESGVLTTAPWRSRTWFFSELFSKTLRILLVFFVFPFHFLDFWSFWAKTFDDLYYIFILRERSRTVWSHFSRCAYVKFNELICKSI